jgi:DUF4097 and DUF4098 domain-containing protein YvlB
MRKLTAIAAALMFALANTGCVINLDADSVVVRDEKTFKAGPDTQLTLETFDGSIQVQSWDRSEVHVEIQRRGPDREAALALEVKDSQDGNTIRIEAPSPRVRHEVSGIGYFSSPSVSFVVRVPEHVKISANTRDGSIAIANVDGTIDLRSGDGSIQASRVSGTLTARTGDGSVRAVDVNGRMSIDTGDGSIHVEGLMADLHADTGDGSIVVEATSGSSVADGWDVSTGDGSITFRVADDFNATVDAESRDGRIRSSIDGLESMRSESGRSTLKGPIGSGGGLVKLHSGDGSIALVKR